MKNTHSKTKLTAVLAGLILGSYHLSALAQDDDVLDSNQHPDSPEIAPIFKSMIVPLDAAMSWTKRFNGDETFSAEQISLKGAASTKMAIDADNSEPGANMHMDANGVVKSIRLSQGKVKISHGPISKYGMPAMTMMFKVKDVSMLEGLNKGEKIGFNVDNSSGGFVVNELIAMAELQSADASSAAANKSKMDASGVVKLVRASQGKVKIAHGPIDKYGMPGMSMMFKVSDPALLAQLEKGATVDFDIDNTSAGFVITNIKPTAN